jgi:hypothetical protein
MGANILPVLAVVMNGAAGPSASCVRFERDGRTVENGRLDSK